MLKFVYIFLYCLTIVLFRVVWFVFAGHWKHATNEVDKNLLTDVAWDLLAERGVDVDAWQQYHWSFNTTSPSPIAPSLSNVLTSCPGRSNAPLPPTPNRGGGPWACRGGGVQAGYGSPIGHAGQ
jgi:hypothetical protein